MDNSNLYTNNLLIIRFCCFELISNKLIKKNLIVQITYLLIVEVQF